jgi:hypothetical protein
VVPLCPVGLGREEKRRRRKKEREERERGGTRLSVKQRLAPPLLTWISGDVFSGIRLPHAKAYFLKGRDPQLCQGPSGKYFCYRLVPGSQTFISF